MKRLLIGVASIVITMSLQPVMAEVLVGRAVRIIDGDTIIVLSSDNKQHRIRLQGIDAPERKQPFGAKSKRTLSDLVAGKKVVVDYTKLDRYKRIIGKLVVNDKDICLELVSRGLAWHYKKYQKEQTEEDRSKYTLSELDARERLVGLWKDPSPIPPWAWRKGIRHRSDSNDKE